MKKFFVLVLLSAVAVLGFLLMRPIARHPSLLVGRWLSCGDQPCRQSLDRADSTLTLYGDGSFNDSGIVPITYSGAAPITFSVQGVWSADTDTLNLTRQGRTRTGRYLFLTPDTMCLYSSDGTPRDCLTRY